MVVLQTFFLCSLLLTLSLSSPAFASLRPGPHPSSLRVAFPTDILGEWKLAYSQNETLCPRSIQHEGWNSFSGGPFRISHDNIVQDGVHCDNHAKGLDQRFRLYTSSTVNAALKNETDGPRVPDRLLQLLRSTGPNINARTAANMLREEYFVGFEATNRLCHGQTFFRRGTTAFLIRPFKRNVNVRKLGIPLTTGTKWLIMIPLYKAISCVYMSELNGFAPAASPEEVESTGGAENELEASVRGQSCFPADAVVRLSDGRAVPMSDLSVNDDVQVGPHLYSTVFTFTHNIPTVRSQFKEIRLRSGNTLRVTDGHFVYANGKLVMASSVQVGDKMEMADGALTTVVSVRTVTERGLYNPQTIQGDIVVDGIRVSTYTSAIKPAVAHSLLSPLRMAHRVFAVDASMGLLAGDVARSILVTFQKMLSP